MTAYDIQASIDQLMIYPVKSCGGMAVDTAVLTRTGLQWDRHWMVVDDLFEAGEFMTQRSLPRMALVTTQLTADALTLSAPGMASLSLPLWPTVPARTVYVRVWSDSLRAFDEGERAAKWFSEFLHHDLRLVRFDPTQQRVASAKWTGAHQATHEFSDGYPLLVVSQASLDELNQKLVAQGHSPVSMLRFRPNLVLGGLLAQDEDRLDVLHVITQEGEVQLKAVKPCPRCPIPNINPVTALSSPEVGDTLQSYRRHAAVDGAVTFGMNNIVLTGIGHTLRVGQTAGANYQFEGVRRPL